MPIQLPSIQRLNAPAPSSTGRIQTQAPEAARTIGQVAGTISEVGHSIIKQYEDIEKQVAQTERLRAGDELERWANAQLDGDSRTGALGLIHIKGDPTQPYNEYDKAFNEKVLEIRSRSSGFSDKVKASIDNELFRRSQSLSNKRSTAWGQQYASYREGVKNASADLAQDSLVESISLLDVKDPNSTAFFDMGLIRIENIIANEALAKGTAIASEKGNFLLEDEENPQDTIRVQLDPTSLKEIKKRKSQGVFNTIDNLLSSKRNEQAKFMLDKYSELIDPVSLAKLNRKLKDNGVDDEARNVLDSIQDLPLPKQYDKLRQIENKEVRQRAQDYLDKDQRQKENLAKRDSTEAYNQLMAMIQRSVDAGETFDNIFELQDDPMRKSLLERVTVAKQAAAVREFIHKPKGQSNLERLEEINDTYAIGAFRNMPFAEFQQLKVGLNQKDSDIFDRLWRLENGPESISQERSAMRFLRDELRLKALAKGLVKVDSRGKIPKSGMQRMAELRNDLDAKFGAHPGTLREGQLSNFVDSIIEENIKKYKPPKGIFDTLKEMIGVGEESEAEEKEAIKGAQLDFTKLTDTQRKALIDEFRKSSNEVPTIERLKKFYSDRKKQ